MTKNTSKGVLIFAKNNEHLNYIKQAEIAARYAQHWLNVPVAIICDEDELEEVDPDLYDYIIPVHFETDNQRVIYDNGSKLQVTYYNDNRAEAFKLSPFDETLLIDSDYLIRNDILNNVWDTEYDFMINHSSSNIKLEPEAMTDRVMADGSLPVFWATAVYFRKSKFIDDFYTTLKMVQANHIFYFRSYQISRMQFRNDFAFSIAYHLMFDNTNALPIPLPVKQINVPMHCTVGKIISHCEMEIEFNTEDQRILSKHRNLHFMDKLSFERSYDKLLEVL